MSVVNPTPHQSRQAVRISPLARTNSYCFGGGEPRLGGQGDDLAPLALPPPTLTPAQAAVVAVSRNLDGSGGVYALDIPTPSCRRPPLVTLRQFRGKGFVRLASGFATDDVYAVDRLHRLHLLRTLDSGGGAGGKGGGGGGGMLEVIGGGGWLLAPRWISWLRSDPIFAARYRRVASGVEGWSEGGGGGGGGRGGGAPRAGAVVET